MAKQKRPAPKKRQQPRREAKRARRGAVRRAPRQNAAPRKPSTGLTPVDSGADLEPPVSPRWRVMQRAAYSLIEQGKPVMQVNLATEIGVSKQAIWKFFQSQPGFLAWLDGEMKAENAHLIGPLARRMFGIAMQGSVPHGEFFAKLVAGHYFRPAGEDGAPLAGAATYTVQMNYLVPRPPMPELAPQAALPPPLHADIPTVAVR